MMIICFQLFLIVKLFDKNPVVNKLLKVGQFLIFQNPSRHPGASPNRGQHALTTICTCLCKQKRLETVIGSYRTYIAGCLTNK